jgi:TolB-like protein
VRRLAADYRVDYVLNGRPLDGDGRRLLIELIRVSDGVHVWVRPYDDLADSRGIGRDISRHIARVLELPSLQTALPCSKTPDGSRSWSGYSGDWPWPREA